jgi:LAO/AO transport system kinase
MWQSLLTDIKAGNNRALARAISLVENEADDFYAFLSSLPASEKKITGITGPPGAGKSTLVDGLIAEIIERNETVAVLCIDPSSPFHHGALLGDRIRMSEWYNHPSVYIRSLATRGSLGGLNPNILEITALLRQSNYQHIIIETVGVGQSEIEIASLADTTVVVVVPEAGDEIQTMKAGLMEIADIFVVNKADRPDADVFVKNLRQMLAPSFNKKNELPVIKTIAAERKGLTELYDAIKVQQQQMPLDEHATIVARQAYHLIQKQRMKDVSFEKLEAEIKLELQIKDFNLYRFVAARFNG